MIHNRFPKPGSGEVPPNPEHEPTQRPRRPLPPTPAPLQVQKTVRQAERDIRQDAGETGAPHPLPDRQPPTGPNLGLMPQANRQVKVNRPLPQGPNWRVNPQVAPKANAQPPIDYHNHPLPPLPPKARADGPAGAQGPPLVQPRPPLQGPLAQPMDRQVSPAGQRSPLAIAGWAPKAAPSPRGAQGAPKMRPRPPGAIALTGPQARTAPHVGQKFKFDARTLARGGFGASPGFSRLESAASNLKLTLTATLARGSFGKVRLARRDDGAMLAVKELRTVAKAGVSKAGRARTYAVSETEMMQEAVDTQRLRDTIEQDMARFDAPFAPAGQRMQGIRLGATPFDVLDMVKVAQTGKVFMVMTREAGDVNQLNAHLPAALRPFAAMSLGAQGFSELATLHHRAATAHMDIKLENFLFNSQGQMKLMDFGLVAPLHNGVTQTAGRVGSLLSPEMVFGSEEDPNKLTALGSANDVWAMAASVIDISRPPSSLHPFYAWPKAVNSAQSLANAQHMFLRFAAWQDGLRAGPRGDIAVERIRPDDYFGEQFYALATQHPALCHILLNDALNLDPTARKPAYVIANKIRALLPQNDNAQAAALRDVMAGFDEHANNLTQLSKETTRFAAWANAPLPAYQPAAPFRGVRPLPG